MPLLAHQAKDERRDAQCPQSDFAVADDDARLDGVAPFHLSLYLWEHDISSKV